jgi:hypothetical protein
VNFVYFIPGENRPVIGWEDLPKRLHSVLQPSPISCKKTPNGPKPPGLLFSPVPSDPEGVESHTLYEPEKQFWEDHGEFWLGAYKNALPTPADLRRPGKPIEGHPVKLADGNEWLMPVVGPYFSKLPRVFRMRDGAPSLEVAERYRELSIESEEFAEFMANQGASKPWVDVMTFVAKCLGLNYHVGLEEVAALGILDTHVTDDALDCIIGTVDYREQEAAKKAG